MPLGMKIYLAVCGLLGLFVALDSLTELIEGGFKGRLKEVCLGVFGTVSGLAVVLIAYLAVLGAIK